MSLPPCALGYSVINDCGISFSMCGSKKAYQKGLTLITYLVDEGREDPNTTMSQPSMPYQQNAIQMLLDQCWPNNKCWLGSFVISGGSGPGLL